MTTHTCLSEYYVLDNVCCECTVMLIVLDICLGKECVVRPDCFMSIWEVSNLVKTQRTINTLLFRFTHTVHVGKIVITLIV